MEEGFRYNSDQTKIARKTGIPTTILVLNVKLENDIEVHIWNVNANKFVTIIHYTMIFK